VCDTYPNESTCRGRFHRLISISRLLEMTSACEHRWVSSWKFRSNRLEDRPFFICTIKIRSSPVQLQQVRGYRVVNRTPGPKKRARYALPPCTMAAQLTRLGGGKIWLETEGTCTGTHRSGSISGTTNVSSSRAPTAKESPGR
jgi:hypothetical protein